VRAAAEFTRRDHSEHRTFQMNIGSEVSTLTSPHPAYREREMKRERAETPPDRADRFEKPDREAGGGED